DNYLAMKQIQVPEPVNSQGSPLPGSTVKNEDASYKEVFMKAIRGQNLTHEEASVMQEYKAALSENTGKDGGFIVPEDITTTINQLKQTTDS
ncbi:phage major capsid protein, partial [Bacillus cereus]|uniref:phage major capsid protein n=1 Tax=Bacillus cereus TaxID=1396 RepID=UPI000BF4AEA1